LRAKIEKQDGVAKIKIIRLQAELNICYPDMLAGEK